MACFVISREQELYFLQKSSHCFANSFVLYKKLQASHLWKLFSFFTIL
jgi:hypothetical protein